MRVAAKARGAGVSRLVALLALLSAARAAAQFFDVPYVPTPQVVVDEMLRLAEVRADDFVIDLGCGDGRIPVTAAAYFGARALGIDIDPGRIAESQANAKAAGVTGRVEFRQGNLFELDIRKATVVTMYLLPDINLKLRPRLFDALRPGTRIVSHDFSMGDWKPDRVHTVQKKIYVWVMPARVAGRWKLEADLPGVGARSYELEVRQKFQEIEPFAREEKRNYAVWEPRLNGSAISFIIVDNELAHRYEGVVEGTRIEGIVRTGAGTAEVQTPFRAVRIGDL
ncbi:MAG: class I SAM-dependent methyltransferase [Betaproteobacteria bacterium]|nr:MAG: class I SAM-dependent methyltransferase [Betaproteobacteria bacterium]RPI48698.1 MAG: class I SAM-dependent methyltransferase [Betaproteobacteria bacterium]